jgi:hypothetical protein
MYQRRDAEEDRSRLSAKISILESLAGRLEKGERIDPSEIARLRKLAGPLNSSKQESTTEETIQWREVFFGRKEHSGTVGTDALDQKDWEKGTLSFDFSRSQSNFLPQWNMKSGNPGNPFGHCNIAWLL